MVNYLRGVKSGAVSGFVSSFIIYCIVLILSLITGSIEPKQTLGITLAISTSFSMWIVISAVFGAILGVIYAVLYSKLPGDNSIKKAILFSFLVFILSTLIPLLAFSVQYSYSAVKEIPISEILSEQFWIFFYALIQFPIFGFLLGKLWDNFGTNEMVTDYSKPMNPKGIKSWHIAAAAVVPTLIVGLFLIGIDILGMLLGEYSEMRGYGIMIGSFFLVVSGILAIPAVLLKTDNRKKIGAISGIILGVLALITMRWLATTDMSSYVVNIANMKPMYGIIESIVGILLILSGIFYFWKKQ